MHMNICEIIKSFNDIKQLITVRCLYIISVAFLAVSLTTQFLDVCIVDFISTSSSHACDTFA